MKKILVPCDFTEPSRQAFKLATQIAGKSGGRIHVLKVIDIPFMYETTFGIQPYWHSHALFPELIGEAESNFQKMLSHHPFDSGRVDFAVVRGPVTQSILDFAHEHGTDLVIMGTRGDDGIKNFFVGSNTEKVVRSCPVPVLSVRNAPEISAVTDIVFPLLPNPDETHLFLHVKELQQFFNARLHLLRVNTPAHFMRDKEAFDALNDLAALYRFENFTVNIRSDTYEQDGIIRFAREMNAGLIAMATHGRKGLAHLITGSIAEDVLSEIDFPIWTYLLRDGR